MKDDVFEGGWGADAPDEMPSPRRTVPVTGSDDGEIGQAKAVDISFDRDMYGHTSAKRSSSDDEDFDPCDRDGCKKEAFAELVDDGDTLCASCIMYEARKKLDEFRI